MHEFADDLKLADGNFTEIFNMIENGTVEAKKLRIQT